MSPAISPVAPSPTLPLSSRRPSVSFGGFGLRLDADVVAWFKGHARDGRGYQTDINHALRQYVQLRESAGEEYTAK